MRCALVHCCGGNWNCDSSMPLVSQVQFASADDPRPLNKILWWPFGLPEQILCTPLLCCWKTGFALFRFLEVKFFHTVILDLPIHPLLDLWCETLVQSRRRVVQSSSIAFSYSNHSVKCVEQLLSVSHVFVYFCRIITELHTKLTQAVNLKFFPQLLHESTGHLHAKCGCTKMSELIVWKIGIYNEKGSHYNSFEKIALVVSIF